VILAKAKLYFLKRVGSWNEAYSPDESKPKQKKQKSYCKYNNREKKGIVVA
jgi:hypothetical protein